MEVSETSPFPVLNETSIDDETSSANTEDNLLSSRNSSETISSTHKLEETLCCQFKKKTRKRFGKFCRYLFNDPKDLKKVFSFIKNLTFYCLQKSTILIKM